MYDMEPTNKGQHTSASRPKQNIDSTLFKGSDEDKGPNCDPCSSDDQHVDARAFCVECEEYLCNTCLECHKKTKASKHHQMLIGKSMDNHSVKSKKTKVEFKKCSKHDELIKFYCRNHDVLGCSDCITLSHRTCDLDYLPDECKNIEKEYNRTMEELRKKLKDAREMMRIAENTDKLIHKSFDEVLEKIYTFRLEIEVKLDEIQKATEKSAIDVKNEKKLKVKDAFTSCENLASSLKTLQKSLKKEKASGEVAELYVNIRKTKSVLESKNLKNAAKSIAATNENFTIDCFDEDFSKVLITESFGDLNDLHSFPWQRNYLPPKLKPCVDLKSDVKEHLPKAETQKTDSGDNVNCDSNSDVYECSPNSEKPNHDTSEDFLKYEGNLSVKSLTDVQVCNITSCAIVSPTTIALADWNNRKLKLFDLTSNTVIDEAYTPESPYDIAALPNGRIAVTIPYHKMIMFLYTEGVLTTFGLNNCSSAPVKYEPRGITYHNNFLYIVCLHPNNITVLDENGRYNHTITLGLDALDRITTGIDIKFLYLSNFCQYPYKNEIVRVTKQGKVSKVYRNKQVHGPVGLVTLDDGSMLVSCINNKTIHRIDSDFKSGRMVNNRVYCPSGISYNKHTRNVYVCQSESNNVKVFSIQ